MLKALSTMWRQLDTRPIEMVYCALTFAWGVSLLLPGDQFAQSAAFEPMATISPDWGWGMIALGIALVRMYGVITLTLWARLFASLGGGFIWSIVWGTMLMRVGTTTGVAVYGVLSTVNLVVFIRLCRTYSEHNYGGYINGHVAHRDQ